MIDDKPEVIQQEGAAPRWIGIVVVVLAIVSLAALGGLTASNRAATLQQTLTAQTKQFSQSDDVMSQRLAKAEDVNAQLQGRTQRR